MIWFNVARVPQTYFVRCLHI